MRQLILASLQRQAAAVALLVLPANGGITPPILVSHQLQVVAEAAAVALIHQLPVLKPVAHGTPVLIFAKCPAQVIPVAL